MSEETCRARQGTSQRTSVHFGERMSVSSLHFQTAYKNSPCKVPVLHQQH